MSHALTLFAGPSTAFKWYAAGCRTLEDLVAGKGGVKLNQVQEIGIKFYYGKSGRAWALCDILIVNAKTSIVGCLVTRPRRYLTSLSLQVGPRVLSYFCHFQLE